MAQKVVLDTNIVVAAGFNPHSGSARILGAVERGELAMAWNHDTRREIEHILRRIPPLAGMGLAHLFRPEHRYDGEAPLAPFGHIVDPDDRKFAALAAATGAVLITNDEHLLQHRGGPVTILTPAEFLKSA